jgi:hypothetical protein
MTFSSTTPKARRLPACSACLAEWQGVCRHRGPVERTGIRHPSISPQSVAQRRQSCRDKRRSPASAFRRSAAFSCSAAGVTLHLWQHVPALACPCSAHPSVQPGGRPVPDRPFGAGFLQTCRFCSMAFAGNALWPRCDQRDLLNRGPLSCPGPHHRPGHFHAWCFHVSHCAPPPRVVKDPGRRLLNNLPVFGWLSVRPRPYAIRRHRSQTGRIDAIARLFQ